RCFPALSPGPGERRAIPPLLLWRRRGASVPGRGRGFPPPPGLGRFAGGPPFGVGRRDAGGEGSASLAARSPGFALRAGGEGFLMAPKSPIGRARRRVLLVAAEAYKPRSEEEPPERVEKKPRPKPGRESARGARRGA